MKLYHLGLVVGRFQTVHNGHASIIKHAIELCDRVVVYIGSSQESNTEHNPFSYNLRERMIETVFPVEVSSHQLVIRPLADIGVGNNDIWGKYVLGAFEAEFHQKPDLYVTGCEKERASWFSDDIAPNMDELRLARNTTKVSASDCRRLMLNDCFSTWQTLVPNELHGMYNMLKEILNEINEDGYAIENDMIGVCI